MTLGDKIRRSLQVGQANTPAQVAAQQADASVGQGQSPDSQTAIVAQLKRSIERIQQRDARVRQAPRPDPLIRATAPRAATSKPAAPATTCNKAQLASASAGEIPRGEVDAPRGEADAPNGPELPALRYELFSAQPTRPACTLVPVRRLPARQWQDELAGVEALPSFEAIPTAIARQLQRPSGATKAQLPWALSQQRFRVCLDTVDASGLLYRTAFPSGEALGASAVFTPSDEELGAFRTLASLELGYALPPLPRDSIVFIDTETTGLSRGTGTIAFMIGLAHFGDDGLIAEQIVVDEPAKEREALELLASRLANCELLISFNGRSFDLPILEARACVNRISAKFDKPHLDLLPLSRRLWRSRLTDCRLGTIERELLAFHRISDLPGAEAPAAYLRYLRDGAFDELAKVLEHNLYDVVVMSLLLRKLTQHHLLPLGWAEDADELTATGRWWAQRCDTKRLDAAPASAEGCRELAEICLRRAVELARQPRSRRQSLCALLRQLKRWRKSESLLEVAAMLSVEFPDDELGWLELAKYHEHIAKDPTSALACAEHLPAQWRPQVAQRIARLRRRLEALGNESPCRSKPREGGALRT